MDVSEFYAACQFGDVPTVKWLLSSFPLAAVDQLEANGSTALHAAASNGHAEIVLLLLEKGASRQQLDVFGDTPTGVAKTTAIKQLFQRLPNQSASRFVAQTLATEWTLNEWDVGSVHNFMLYGNGRNPSVEEVSAQLITTEELQDCDGMEQIVNFLRLAAEKNDPTLLVRAYTAETDFYKILNRTLAEQIHAEGRMRMSNSPPWFVVLPRALFHRCARRQYSWAGTTYRGMQMTADDLHRYTVGQRIISKAFLSTSKSRQVAERFLGATSSAGALLVICSYTITTDDIALDIETISEYPDEQEVLLLPGMGFEVTHIQSNGRLIDIELKSCDKDLRMGRTTTTMSGGDGIVARFVRKGEDE